MASKTIDMTGKVFSDLTVAWPEGKRGTSGGVWWLCFCSCGKFLKLRGESLRRGMCNSCGCKRKANQEKGNRIAGRNVRSEISKIQYNLWANAKCRSKKKDLDFSITPKDIEVPEQCPLLGIDLNLNPKGVRQGSSPSLDRRDTSRGYTKENIWVISWRANNLKSDASFEEMNTLVSSWRKYVINSDSR